MLRVLEIAQKKSADEVCDLFFCDIGIGESGFFCNIECFEEPGHVFGEVLHGL